jgi:hypothetical protein
MGALGKPARAQAPAVRSGRAEIRGSDWRSNRQADEDVWRSAARRSQQRRHGTIAPIDASRGRVVAALANRHGQTGREPCEEGRHTTLGGIVSRIADLEHVSVVLAVLVKDATMLVHLRARPLAQYSIVL